MKETLERIVKYVTDKRNKILTSKKGRKVIVALATLVYGGIYMNSTWYPMYKNFIIGRNLEPDAIHFGYLDNRTQVSSTTLSQNPIMRRNIDIDGNGKYESILVYTGEDGKIWYTPVIRTKDGKTHFGVPYHLPETLAGK